MRDVNNLLDEDSVNKQEAVCIFELLTRIDSVLGVASEIKKEEALPKEAQGLIAKREEARKSKDWKTADLLRHQLKTMGVVIEDTAQGVRWRKEKV